MTATEKVMYAGAKLRDLIEARYSFGPDSTLEADIEDAYQDFLGLCDEEWVELDVEEDELNMPRSNEYIGHDGEGNQLKLKLEDGIYKEIGT